MRGPLVKHAFYGGAGSLPIDRFLPIVRLKDALETLLDARAAGAYIRDIEGRLEECNVPDLWLKYACQGRTETDYVLDRHSELIGKIFMPALRYCPDRSIPILLSEAARAQAKIDVEQASGPIPRQNPVFGKIETMGRGGVS